MTFEIIFVLLALLGMVIALVLDKMRPGMVLFSVVVLFLCAGILTPKEMLEGFSNKGMITVAMLFLVSEGIRQSGALGQLIKKLLPQGKTTVFKAQLRMLPTISFISAFLNNTPVVVIFAPITPTPLSGILTLQTPVPLSQLHTTVSVSFSRFSSKRSGLVFFIFFPLTVTSFGAFAE